MKFLQPSQVHQISNEVYPFIQRDFETYLEAWDKFKSVFRKCSNLDILNWHKYISSIMDSTQNSIIL